MRLVLSPDSIEKLVLPNSHVRIKRAVVLAAVHINRLKQTLAVQTVINSLWV